LLKGIATTVVVASTLLSSRVFANDTYAGPACSSGCSVVDHLTGSGHAVYYGEDARTYRICAGQTWTVDVTVDGQGAIRLDPSLHRQPVCTDVRGKSIVVSGDSSGIAFVGPVAP
jgi:hypothetical protein